MNAVIALIIRIAAAGGVSLSPFVAGVVMSGVVVLGLGIAGHSLYSAGYESAENACEAAALRAKLETVTIERDSLNGRAARAEGRVRDMAPVILRQETENAQLAEQVKRLQSTKEGAKRDAGALMDDRCNLVGAGRRRLH